MCGVIGYVGSGASPQFFFHGLKNLEYRGYDSAGIAMLHEGKFFIQRAEGKLVNLEKKLALLPPSATVGLGHTRWATHGKPTENNAHPHCSHHIVLLHNGIIENEKVLKTSLLEKGYVFKSETDTEAAVHLLHHVYTRYSFIKDPTERMKTAILEFVQQLKGSFAFGILCEDTPDVLFAVKSGSPLVIGFGQGENYIASGMTALVDSTKTVVVMEDGEIALLKAQSVSVFRFDGTPVFRDPIEIAWSKEMLAKDGYDHFMRKEISEHPSAVANTLRERLCLDTGRVDPQKYGFLKTDLRSVNRLQLIACGTSFYAGCVARYFIERFTGLPVDVDLASEARYRVSTVTPQTLCVAISQSGETIDTLQAIKFARQKGAQTIALVNVLGSSIAHATHDESLLHAGPEIGVASTKAFSAQISSLLVLGLCLAQEQRLLSAADIACFVDQLANLSGELENALLLSDRVKKIAEKYHAVEHMLFIGRGCLWPVALEGALKLKELSYIHAEGYAAGELKHGPIALIDEHMTVVCLAPRDAYYGKTVSNIEEIRARGGKILAIGTEGDTDLEKISDDFIGLPACGEVALPFVTTVPLHLFAYWMAVFRGTDVDQPRNLAKSVTVE